MSYCLLIWAALAASPDESISQAPEPLVATQTTTSLAELRRQFSAASRRAASKSTGQQSAAAKDLVALLDVTHRSSHLPERERERLAIQIRLRLQKISKDIELRMAREEKARARGLGQIGVRDSAVLAQQLAGQPGAGFAAPPMARNEGQDLIDLIQRTIAPDTWDVNGGPGHIAYFGNFKVMVVRQQSEVHAQLGGLIDNLRKP